VFEVQEKLGGRSAQYKLTSTAMLWLQTNKAGSGTMNLGGSLTRQVSTNMGDSIIVNFHCLNFSISLISNTYKGD
jgi:hypothetical protein